MPTSVARGSAGLSSTQTATAETSNRTEPTPDAMASPWVNAPCAASSSAAALSAGMVDAASTAPASESRADAATEDGVPGGTAKPR